VIVVDNRSTDDTPELVKRYAESHANLHYLFEPILGLSRARNAGLEQVTTRYVAYIDDDAIPERDWLEQIVWAFEKHTPHPAIVAGEIDPIWEAPRPEWLAQRHLHMLSVCPHWGTEPRDLTNGEWACEANSAYEASALRQAGGFPENLGRKGPVLLSGENMVNDIIVHRGGRIFFNPRARVRHLIAANRLTIEWMRSRSFWGGVTAAIVEKEMSRLTGAEAKWRDLSLPSSSWEWADVINCTGDSRLERSFDHVYNVGYCFSRMGVFPL
jgi:glycosyltransferase involved in cell wall biosynthesis